MCVFLILMGEMEIKNTLTGHVSRREWLDIGFFCGMGPEELGT